MTTPDTKSIVVVCAADNGYAMPLAVMICSVIENLKSDCKLDLFVIDGGIKEYNKRKIIRALESAQWDVKWVQPPDGLLEKMKLSGHITVATYYRLLIPELLPRQFKKAIYLDSDLIVNEDLGKLWNIDMGENYLLAVQDTSIPYVSSPGGLVNYKELGILPNHKYFNAGVLVINLEKWRAERIDAKVIKYLEQNRDCVRWWDQDGLNAVLVGKWRELDPRWNQTPAIYSYPSWRDSPFPEKIYSAILNNPYIIHFASASKPWNSRDKHPATNLFFQYLDMTAWSGWRLTFWRRLWRRLVRDMKQLRGFVSPLKT